MSQSKTLKKEKLTFNTIWQRYGTFGILIILLAILAILKPTYFFSSSTAPQILAQSSVNILIAMGEFFAILIAGIDLSVGSVVALTGMCMAKLMVAGVNPIVAVLLGILLGAFLGFLNGLLVNVTGLHPFIITLGTQAIYRGVTLIISNSSAVYGFPASFTRVISKSVIGIPLVAIIAVIVALILAFLTKKRSLVVIYMRLAETRIRLVFGYKRKSSYPYSFHYFRYLRRYSRCGSSRSCRLGRAGSGNRL